MTAYALMPRRAPALVADVTAFVDRELHDARFRIDAVAEALSLSPRQFRRLFLELAGQTPRAFLRQRRVERARALLADETLLVADVARAVGYADASAFGRAFRAVTGEAPRAARDLIGSDNLLGNAAPPTPGGVAYAARRLRARQR